MKRTFIHLAVMSLVSASPLLGQGTSAWVFFGPDNLLHYATDDRGNRIMDFSYAGYKGGGVQLPVVPVAATLSPVDGDNTSNIQTAIDSVCQLPPDSNGFRGAVLLAAGTYDVAGTVTITASGVVLRGSGSGADGTIINLTGSPHRFLEIRGGDCKAKPRTDTVLRFAEQSLADGVSQEKACADACVFQVGKVECLARVDRASGDRSS